MLRASEIDFFFFEISFSERSSTSYALWFIRGLKMHENFQSKFWWIWKCSKTIMIKDPKKKTPLNHSFTWNFEEFRKILSMKNFSAAWSGAVFDIFTYFISECSAKVCAACVLWFYTLKISKEFNVHSLTILPKCSKVLISAFIYKFS